MELIVSRSRFSGVLEKVGSLLGSSHEGCGFKPRRRSTENSAKFLNVGKKTNETFVRARNLTHVQMVQ